MINSLLILRSSDFIWFSKSYDQQFGDQKDKNKWTTLMRAIIIKQYYHYKFQLELNIKLLSNLTAYTSISIK